MKKRRSLILLPGLLLYLSACGGDQAVHTAPGLDKAAISTPASPPPASPARQETDSLAALLGAIDGNRQFSWLSTLASDRFEGRLTGSAGAAMAADYIEAEFSRLGLKTFSAAGLGTLRQPFAAAGPSGGNVIGVIPGSDSEAGFVILAAHYDHLGVDEYGQAFNGADDNAAGVAAVLEAATVFQQTGVRPKKTIVFCAFDGEEEGLLGASALGQRLVDAGLAGRVEMINIDGIGAACGSYLGVWDEGFAGSAPLVDALSRAGSMLATPVVEEGTDIGSDAQAFTWQYGLPAVTVDWHWGDDEDVCHPYYHTVDDDPQYIDRAVMAQATRVIFAGLWLCATS